MRASTVFSLLSCRCSFYLSLLYSATKALLLLPKTDDGSQAVIACDNPSCKFKWFHFQCVGLQEEENLVAQWFCPSFTLAL